MAKGINKAIILGHLGGDPELRHTPGGNAVANFSVATSESWKDKDGNKQEKTEWHRVIAWGKTAENANQYLKKGSKVYVEGKLQTRSWDDRDGVKRYTTEIVAREVVFLDSQNSNGSYPPAPSDADAPGVERTTTAKLGGQDVDSEDDLPF